MPFVCKVFWFYRAIFIPLLEKNDGYLSVRQERFSCYPCKFMSNLCQHVYDKKRELHTIEQLTPNLSNNLQFKATVYIFRTYILNAAAKLFHATEAKRTATVTEDESHR